MEGICSNLLCPGERLSLVEPTIVALLRLEPRRRSRQFPVEELRACFVGILFIVANEGKDEGGNGFKL